MTFASRRGLYARGALKASLCLSLLPSTCPSQVQDPLVIQGKQIIYLGAIRLDQDKLFMVQEERQIFFFPNAKWNEQTKLTRDFLMDKPSQLEIPSIEQMINRHQCLSDNQNNIYAKKSMSLSRYTQLVILTNVKAQSMI